MKNYYWCVNCGLHFERDKKQEACVSCGYDCLARLDEGEYIEGKPTPKAIKLKMPQKQVIENESKELGNADPSN